MSLKRFMQGEGYQRLPTLWELIETDLQEKKQTRKIEVWKVRRVQKQKFIEMLGKVLHRKKLPKDVNEEKILMKIRILRNMLKGSKT